MNDIISSEKMSQVFTKALQKGILNDNDNSAIFYDLTFLKYRLTELKKSFPKDTLHAIAVKANPLPSILKKQLKHLSKIHFQNFI